MYLTDEERTSSQSPVHSSKAENGQGWTNAEVENQQFSPGSQVGVRNPKTEAISSASQRLHWQEIKQESRARHSKVAQECLNPQASHLPLRSLSLGVEELLPLPWDEVKQDVSLFLHVTEQPPSLKSTGKTPQNTGEMNRNSSMLHLKQMGCPFETFGTRNIADFGGFCLFVCFFKFWKVCKDDTS